MSAELGSRPLKPAFAATRPMPVQQAAAQARIRISSQTLHAATLACIVLALGTLVLPVVLVHMPPLLDYPNHLARMWLLTGGADEPPLNSIYAVDWSGASTNIGIDLLAASVGRLTGAWALGKLLLAAAVLLPPLGAVLLNRAVFGGWHWWQAGFAVLAWNATMLAGFLNFQIGLGLALIATSADPAAAGWAGPGGAALIRMAFGAALLVFHPFAAGFYGLLLAGLAVGGDRRTLTEAASLGGAARRAVAAGGLGVGVPILCFTLLAPTLPGTHAPPGVYSIWENYNPGYKLLSVMSAFLTYDVRLDLAAIFLLWVAARIVPPARLMRCHAGLALTAVLLFTLTLVFPPTLADGTLLDWRFSIMALLTVAAAVRPGFASARAGGAAAAALMLLAMARTGWVGSIWQDRQADVAAVEQVLALIPPGAAVLPAQHVWAEGKERPQGHGLSDVMPWYSHLQSLVVPLRHAFVPTLFASPGKQPLRVLEPWAAMASRDGYFIPVEALRSFTPTPQLLYTVGYALNWRRHFDYVLILNAQLPVHEDEGSLPELELLADRGFSRLYRVRH